MRDMRKYIDLLCSIIECAEEENKKLFEHKSSLWSIDLLQGVVIPEIAELLSYARRGIVLYKYGKKHRLLKSVYFMSDSLNNLSSTTLGALLICLQDLYNKL